jgi:hypothetical protein
MSKGFDVKKIREEIDRKKSQSQVINAGGSQIAVPRTGDAFLRDLVTSLNTGRATDAVKKMQIVEQVAEEKKPSGIKSKRSAAGFSSDNIHSLINTTSTNEGYEPISSPEPLYEDREELMAKKIEQQNKGLANKYQNGAADVSHLVEQFYGKQPAKQQIAGNSQPLMGQISANYINEEVDRRFNAYINENMGAILEGAIKNTIIEMYSKERVKAVLQELDIDGMIKEGVLRTIKQLQERKKQKGS